jgi:hypothetical protein
VGRDVSAARFSRRIEYKPLRTEVNIFPEHF